MENRMKKKYVCAALLLMVSGAVAADIISDKQGLGVNKADIDLLLKPAPVNVQLEALKQKPKFKEKLEEMYLTKAIAAEVKKTPLSAEEQAELDEMQKMFYFKVKIKQLSEQNLPDFAPLAAAQYKANKEKYVEPEQVAVEHILLDTRQKYKDKEALKLAKNLIAQLKKGADFGALALKYSNDPSVKQNKGQLGFFSKGKMLKEFEDAAYQLKLQELSEPVQTQYGYHILRKYGQKASAIKDFAAVKDEIIAKLKADYVQNRLTDYYEQVKTDNAMQVDEKALDAYIAEKIKQLAPAPTVVK
jgi:parvulin-like peptidyl-prolyl isomerase